jgi:hypothetical protein
MSFSGHLQDRQKKNDGKKPMVKTSPAAIDLGKFDQDLTVLPNPGNHG